jgi:hypothetical protein
MIIYEFNIYLMGNCSSSNIKHLSTLELELLLEKNKERIIELEKELKNIEEIEKIYISNLNLKKMIL